MRFLSALPLLLIALPAQAAGGPFFTLNNTNFVVTIAFLLFISVIVYLKVPGLLGSKLDERAEGIRKDLDEAKALREEAQTILASYERKQKEVAEQAERIIETAKREAEAAAEQAKADLKTSITRRLQGAEEQIASAESAAVKQVRDQAVQIAVAAAGDVIAKALTAADASALIDASIKDVKAKLH